MLEIALITLASIAGLILLLYAIFANNKKKSNNNFSFPENYRLILKEYVDFYNELDEAAKMQFENHLQYFPAATRITGVNTDVEDVDRVLLAASAIIPILGFADPPLYQNTYPHIQTRGTKGLTYFTLVFQDLVFPIDLSVWLPCT
jgi:hypothetical protein